MDYRQWQVGNDSPVWMKPRKHVHFLYRYPDGLGEQRGRREDFETPSGRLKSWAGPMSGTWKGLEKKRAAAQRFADRLNGVF